MSPALLSVFNLIDQYGYIMLLLLAIVEGPIVCVIAGFILAQGALDIFPVYVILLVGDVSGDLFWYSVGYYGAKHPWAYRLMAKHAERIEAFKKRFRDNLLKAIFVAKYMQTGIVAMPAAGATRMPLGLFILYNFLSSLPKTALLMIAGYFFGFALSSIDTGLRIGSVVLGVVTLFLLVIYYRRFMRQEKIQNS